MRSAFSALAVLGALSLPAVAHADTTDLFSLSGQGLSLSFSLPSNPTPTRITPTSDFAIRNISFVENGTSRKANQIRFFTLDQFGAFELDNAAGVIDGLSFEGPQLFTGALRNPTFKLGEFDLTRSSCGSSVAAAATGSLEKCPAYTLEITPITAVAATPEPGSLALLGTGALGAIGVLRRRFAR